MKASAIEKALLAGETVNVTSSSVNELYLSYALLDADDVEHFELDPDEKWVIGNVIRDSHNAGSYAQHDRPSFHTLDRACILLEDREVYKHEED